MKLTKIYIGSNNDTKELELNKILRVMEMAQAGYTLIKAQGVYRTCVDTASQQYNLLDEETAIIEIYGSFNTGIIPELKRELKQDYILVAEFISEAKLY